MMSEHLCPIDANGHVPADPRGRAPAAITDPVAAEFERLARCHECGLITLHSWDCRTGQIIKDVAMLLDAAEVIDRRWPEWKEGTPIAGAMRRRAERLSRTIA